MKMLIATSQRLFCRTRSEILAENLSEALGIRGHRAEVLRIPFEWNAERVPDQMLACRLMRLTHPDEPDSDALIALDFPTYALRHPRKILWLTGTWIDSDTVDGSLGQRAPLVAAACSKAEGRFIVEAEKVYTISAGVSRRIRSEHGIEALPLSPPPPGVETLSPGPAEDHLLVPVSEDHPFRLELLARALGRTQQPVQLCLLGRVSQASSCTSASAVQAMEEAGRWRWLPDKEDLLDLAAFGRCRGVMHVGLADTFPWASQYAMASAKPIVVCIDSGAPAELVRQLETGIMSRAEPAELAAAMDKVWSDPSRARAWGRRGREGFDSDRPTWDAVIQALFD